MQTGEMSRDGIGALVRDFIVTIAPFICTHHRRDQERTRATLRNDTPIVELGEMGPSFSTCDMK